MLPRALIALPIAVLGILAALPAIVSAQADPDGPVLVYQSMHEGDTINAPVFGIQLCFSAPINIKDLDKGGDFKFSVAEPDGIGLGHRDIFQPDGYGIFVQPGNAPGETSGQWTFTYRVTTPDARHATEGTIHYTVDPSGETRPTATPPPCVASGGTATASPTPDPNASPTSTARVGSPAPTSSAPGSSSSPAPTISSHSTGGSPTPTEGTIVESDGSGPNIDTLAYLTIGAAGVAALIALVGFAVRRRVGFDWHKPGDGGDKGHH